MSDEPVDGERRRGSQTGDRTVDNRTADNRTADDRTANGPVRLRNAQREIRDAYFDHDAGLFTMNCVAGTGKSVVAHRIAAEDVLRRYVAGDRTPEQRVAVVSFNTDEAADIIPSVCDHLREVAAHDLIPEAEQITDREVEYLVTRVRRAPLVGTVDSLLRDVFEEIAPDVGFTEMPAVGNEALLARVHAECYGAVAADPDHVDRVNRLEDAYPAAEYEDGLSAILDQALEYCRDQRLSTADFVTELRRTRDAVYPEGRTASVADIAATIARYTDHDTADRTASSLDDEEKRRLVAADRRLYDTWTDAIEAFRAVFDAYRTAYRDRIREYGVASHTDVAFLVASYLDDDLPDAAASDSPDDRVAKRRERLIGRYRGRLGSVIVDEAQDVAAIQHDALAHLVTPKSRVFVCGDTLQSIYLWRNADPSLFAGACREGRYFGIDWDTHVATTATTTYRCRPDVASGINAIVGPVFADPTRGGLSDSGLEFPGLDAHRESTDEPGVHVAAFTGTSDPGSATWVDREAPAGEATMMATYVARGIADGTFTDETGEPLSVTVLFRRRTRMADYEDAFAAEGLTVWNASENLFECPVVETVLDVCDWLAEPADPARMRDFLFGSEFDVDGLRGALERYEYDLDAMLAEHPLAEDERHVLSGARTLRDRLDRFATVPASAYVEDIIEAFGLRADPHDHFSHVAAAQRVANLDALTAAVDDWEADEQYAPKELTALLDPFRENPDEGPTQPSSTATDHDVVFKTIHRAKGDQDDVVALADPGFKIWEQGLYSQRFVAQNGVAALAPPTNTDTASDISLPPFDAGLYDPDGDHSNGRGVTRRDVGLRWGTERWVDDDGALTLLGPERVGRIAAATRAESWRLLYVALSRASDHLLVPLPYEIPGTEQPRDRWLDSIHDALGFPDDRSGTYAHETWAGGVRDDTKSRRETFDIAVNDVDLFAEYARTPTGDTALVGATPPRRNDLDPWVPRFLDPSTAYPLTEDVDATVLRHLLDEPIHTETDDVTAGLPLTFETLGPEAIGTCLHDALTKLVVRDVSESEIRSLDDSASDVLNDAIDEVSGERSARAPETEREGITTFFAEFVVDPFLDSALWKRIQSAETVYVEHDLDGLLAVDDLEVEIHGTADFLIELKPSEWHVTDLKISLTESTSRTRSRYQLQVAAYAHLLRRQLGTDATIRRGVETFGVARESIDGTVPPVVLERRLGALATRSR